MISMSASCRRMSPNKACADCGTMGSSRLTRIAPVSDMEFSTAVPSDFIPLATKLGRSLDDLASTIVVVDYETQTILAEFSGVKIKPCNEVLDALQALTGANQGALHFIRSLWTCAHSYQT